MTLTNIKAALVNAYVTGAFGVPTAYENADFEPPVNEPWARVWLLPTQPEVSSLGENGYDQHDGVLQIDLFYPRGEGDGNALAKADQIRRLFYAGAHFEHNGQTVIIRSCGRSAGRIDHNHYTITLTINWYALSGRRS